MFWTCFCNINTREERVKWNHKRTAISTHLSSQIRRIQKNNCIHVTVRVHSSKCIPLLNPKQRKNRGKKQEILLCLHERFELELSIMSIFNETSILIIILTISPVLWTLPGLSPSITGFLVTLYIQEAHDWLRELSIKAPMVFVGYRQSMPSQCLANKGLIDGCSNQSKGIILRSVCKHCWWIPVVQDTAGHMGAGLPVARADSMTDCFYPLNEFFYTL